MRSAISPITFVGILMGLLLTAATARAEGTMVDGIAIDTGITSYTYLCVMTGGGQCQDIVIVKGPSSYPEGTQMCAYVNYNASCDCHPNSSPTTEGYCLRF